MIHLSKNKSEINWKKEFTADWFVALSEIFDSDYSKHLSNFIEQIYLSDKKVYPMRSRLFTPFKRVSLKDVKVVVIDDKPVKDLRSSGIGRGLIEDSSLTKDLPLELRQFRDCIYQTIYGNQYSITSFDNSLDDYCDNDMLFLNVSMCIDEDRDYSIIWKHFIRNVIKEINERNEKVAYIFLSNTHLDLCNYIDENKNKIIINSFPDLILDSPIFLELDEYVEDNYPQYSRIVW